MQHKRKTKYSHTGNINRKYFVPKDTYDLISKNLYSDNFYIQHQKFARYEKDKFHTYNKNHKDRFKYGGIYKFRFDKDFIANINRKQQVAIKNLNLKKECVEQSINWRLIVGLGNPSVYETSITLHHIYGIPYIPASAVKGVVRHFTLEEKFKSDENKALKNKEFCDVFGCDNRSIYKEARQGNIIFFDAFPTEPPLVEPDVMNVHYPNYYGGNEAPTDYQNPNPIFFLTVKETKFHFTVGIKKKVEDQILETAFNWLKQALSEHGIGAKTAVGYGRMK